jgi:hypothetical protein
MSASIQILRQSFAAYGRSFRTFVLASGFLSLPIAAVSIVRSLIAAETARLELVGFGMAGATTAVLSVVDLLAITFTCAALTLLAADIQTGGHWGWRGAWLRVFRRARPIVTANLAAFVLIMAMAVPGVLIAAAISTVLAQASGPGVFWPTMQVFLSLLCVVFAFVDPVTTVEGGGGFRAAFRSFRLLRRDSPRGVPLLWLVSLPLWCLDPLTQRLFPSSPVPAEVVKAVGHVFLIPLIAQATLIVYRQARTKEDGYADVQLRADLDAI